MTKKHFLIAMLLLIVANIALFWKFYFKGLLPFPGDLLVSYYFPWNSGGFPSFDPWTTRKDVIAMDVIRMMYPLKSLIVDQISKGQLPLWNPYNFSGTPLLANLQSTVFFPTTLLLMILPLLNGWVSLVLLLPLLFGFFNYLFFRSFRLPVLPAIFGAIVIVNLSYLTVWTEQLNILQAALFLPLILWLINRYVETKRIIHIFILPIFVALTIIGGHPQTSLYVLLISFLYGLFKRVPVIALMTMFFLGAALSAIQLLPTIELYLQSAREGKTLHNLILQVALPWKHLATLFAPDFFGNPATANFYGRNYDNSLGYFGIAAAVLACVAVVKNLHQREVKFFFFLALFGLVFALPPFAYLFVNLKIPILSSGFPSRMIFLFQFGMGVLSAFGLQEILERDNGGVKKTVFILTIFVAIYLVLLVSTITSGPTLGEISRHNLIFPLLIFASVAGLLVSRKTLERIFPRVNWPLTVGISLIFVAIVEYGYFFNKYQPFASAKFVFPPHPVLSYLQNNAGVNRFFGFDRAYIDNNFATYYRIFSAEGYDPLFIRRYGQLLGSSDTGTLPDDIPSYDAWMGKMDNSNRDRLRDLLGVKYIIDKTDDPTKEWAPDLNKFPPDKYDMVWRVNKWKIFVRKSALPRAFLASNYIVETDDQKIIEKIYDQSFDYRQSLVLEKDPAVAGLSLSTGSANIVEYQPNKVVVQTKADGPKLLFLSDNHYPGWQVTVDNNPSEILRADYAFRAVALPPGNHEVKFSLRPKSFEAGALLTGLSLITLTICLKKFCRT